MFKLLQNADFTNLISLGIIFFIDLKNRTVCIHITYIGIEKKNIAEKNQLMSLFRLQTR